MTKYYIFRHGETMYSKDLVPYPKNSRSIKILSESIPTLEKIAKYLKKTKPDICISSEYIRCRQSTEIISKISGLNFEKNPRLNEYSQESFKEFKKRVKRFIYDLEEKRYKTVVICTHGAVIAGIKNYLNKDSFTQNDLTDYPKTGVILCIEGDKIEEIVFNSI